MIGIVFITGLLLGSFYNVCIYRIPRKISLLYPLSYCVHCNHQLGAIDLIPVISYCLSKGHCRYCRQRIPVRYPLVELTTGLLFTLVYYEFNLNCTFFAALVLTSILIIVSLIDMYHQVIPNSLVVSGTIVAVVLNALNLNVAFIDGLLGGIAGSGILLLVRIVSLLILKKEGMGWGDIQLMVVIGLFLGWKLSLLALLLSIYAGGITSILLILLRAKKVGQYISFGPFIAVGTFISMLWGNDIIYWYIQRVW